MDDVTQDKRWQQIEGALACIAGIGFYLAVIAIFPWWAAIVLFFAPDLSFLGYLFGPRIGAVCYNTVHIYGFGAVLALAGYVMGWPVVFALGLLWAAHCGFDRMLGYGLKRSTAFTSTHMGEIGKK
ncbi:DUF4260 domain-containing protein [Octadecabacter sp. G9-8]|uniref:DUF4260 domain-containing protein n=1 Tax=Octadecabacter dasysiphoniae TaxID=2909341 RepID=A0ABS9CYP8_9RHOB|nr:DUF4260 domain-containing protein [Octadecabacter dasysiphoniae]MCF2872278.1 DUF4260 domain-containing protein [Octadecabacter dasysiphoniae]